MQWPLKKAPQWFAWAALFSNNYFRWALCPLVTGLLAFWLRLSAGPFWLGSNLDPSYLYLFNAAYILDGIAPMFTDHPGTTLQLFMVPFIRLFMEGPPGSSVVEAIAFHAEMILHLTWAGCLFLFLTSLGALGWAAFRSFGLWSAVSAQVMGSIFLLVASNGFKPGLPVLANVNAEIFLVSLMNFFYCFLLKMDHQPALKRDALGLGLLAGACFVTKMTFLPFIFLPLFFFKRGQFAVYGSSVFVSVVALTWPIWSRFDKWWDWTRDLVMKSGAHGSGQSGSFLWAEWLPSLIGQARHDWVLVLLAGLVVIVFFCTGRRAKLPLCIAFFVPLQILFTAKQFGPQYLVPAIGGVGILAAFLVASVRDERLQRMVAVSLMIILLGAVIIRQFHLSAVRDDLLAFNARLNAGSPDCLIAGAYRASSPEYALFFGHSMHYKHNGEVAYFRPFGFRLAKYYPQVVSFDYWTGQFYGFGRTLTRSDLQLHHVCLKMHTMEGGKIQTNFFKEIDRCKTGEKLYKLYAK